MTKTISKVFAALTLAGLLSVSAAGAASAAPGKDHVWAPSTSFDHVW